MNTRFRFALLGALTVFALTFGFVGMAAPIHAQDKLTELRIGYQRNGVWPLLKAKGILEKQFADVKVTWVVFPAGPQLLEALNAGAIDIGATGETPPIFAQAAGTPLKYVAQLSGNGAGSAVLVPENSPIKTLADLKGKKVAFQKASSAHLLLVRSLEKGGLIYSQVDPAFLAPPEARAAFQGGSVDAWVIWDPFRAAAIKELNARILVAGENVSPTKSYIEASNKFVAEHPDELRAIISDVQTWQTWTRSNIDEYADILAKETGLAVDVIKFSLQTEIPDYYWIDEDAIAYQQKVADIFFDLKLIPEKLNIRDVVWIGGKNPAPAASATGQATQAATAAH